jgi:hypothetical protein
MAAMRSGSTTVTVAEEESTLVLTITGALDADGADLVQEAAAALIDADGGARVVEVDLRGAAPLTVDGLRVVARCAALGRVRFRFGAPADGTASGPPALAPA